MRQDKYNRIIQQAQYHRGQRTVEHVLSTVINDPDIAQLPGRVIGKVANIRHAAYVEGKSQGLEVIDGCVWIDGVGLIPLEIIREIKITDSTTQTIIRSDNPAHSYDWHTIYRDAACTDRIYDRRIAVELTECWYIERLIHKTYTLNAVE